MTTTFYQYPKCSTCRKAKGFLEDELVAGAFESIDIVAKPPTKSMLKALWERSGKPLKAFFNTSGESYKNGKFKDRLATMSEDEQLAALAADGKLIKRPILDTGKAVLVGFAEAEWKVACRK
jgi:arsenate reductase